MSAASAGDLSLRGLWSRLAAALRGAGIADAEIEAEVMLRHALGMVRAEYFASLGEPVPPNMAARAEGLSKRRVDGEPLAYITGRREFQGLEFLVDERVLVPRQETELLVDLALEACVPRHGERMVITDAGTGSGAVAVALASQLPSAVVYATDVSTGALEVARSNAERHGVAERVHFLCGDLLCPVPERADVIVSNPPYVTTGELAELPSDVRREPTIALDGGPDGMQIIARLLEQASRLLRPGGAVFVEMAPEQRGAVARMAAHRFPGATIEVIKDGMGQNRVLGVRTSGG